MATKMPDRLLHHCKNPRLRKLINRVYARLPAHDRAVLRELLWWISDKQDKDNVFGYAGAPTTDSLIPGNPGQMAEDMAYRINLGHAIDVYPDAACMFIIAHELAHVVLRHAAMSEVMDSLMGLVYTEEDNNHRAALHEDQTNLLVWAWGFQKEMAAFLEHYPDAPKPRWYVNLEIG